MEHCDTYLGNTVCLAIRLPASDGARSDAFAVIDADWHGIARRLSAELDASDSAAELAIESLSAQIDGRVRVGHNREPVGSRWIRRVRDWIEEEYANPPTLGAIAAAVDRNESHVATIFKKTYGKTIGDHLRDIRVWRTRGLVEDASVPLAEVAQRAGFADQSHFGRVFKRRFAISPYAYRRRVAPRAQAPRSSP